MRAVRHVPNNDDVYGKGDDGDDDDGDDGDGGDERGLQTMESNLQVW